MTPTNAKSDIKKSDIPRTKEPTHQNIKNIITSNKNITIYGCHEPLTLTKPASDFCPFGLHFFLFLFADLKHPMEPYVIRPPASAAIMMKMRRRMNTHLQQLFPRWWEWAYSLGWASASCTSAYCASALSWVSVFSGVWGRFLVWFSLESKGGDCFSCSCSEGSV